ITLNSYQILEEITDEQQIAQISLVKIPAIILFFSVRMVGNAFVSVCSGNSRIAATLNITLLLREC
uniref:hypothetical protein n=1 Tax=Kuenenia stuttgartiensis TaxID=174633 RepID=UPI00146C0D4B